MLYWHLRLLVRWVFKVAPPQIVAALKKMGFAAIEEVAVGADMTALHETKEFMEKVPARQKIYD